MANCKIEECEKPSRNRGWCQMHYKRFTRHGDPNLGARVIDRKCSIEGCGKPHHGQGFCDLHWYRNHVHGDPAGGGRNYSSGRDSFAARTVVEGECVVWVGGQVRGYGSLKDGGKNVYAHRFAWASVYGEIPAGHVIDHICHNTLCVRVEHLRVATPGENARNRGGPSVLSRSGVRGVYPRGDKWFAQVGMMGRSYYLGTFETKDAANEAAKAKREELFGDYAGRQ